MRSLGAAHPRQTVRLIETHISFVLLDGAYAYKIKKAVNLGFLDFTTLALRRHFCEEELRLNRRFAPQLYLDVIAVTCEGGLPTLGGSGAVIDVALRMRAFAQDGLWEQLIERGGLEAKHVDQLAQSLCGLHRDATVSSSDSRFGEPAQLRVPMLETLDALDTVLIESQRKRLADLRAWEAPAFTALQRHFARRRTQGRVRECHGDLHLGNVTLIDGQATMFDCLEFDAGLRCTDVMSDVAFMAMDLMRHARSDLAYRFVNATLECSGDYDGARVLRYYIVYRALVRAKVAALRGAQAPRLHMGSQAGPASDPVQAYLEVACACIAPSPPVLFVAHGFSGSGKTIWTGRLLESIGAIRIRADVERKRLANLPPLTNTASELRAGLYSSATRAATHQRLREAAKSVLRGGFHAILDATFLRAKPRDQARSLAQELGVRCVILDFQASAATLRQRIAARTRLGNDASEAGLAVLDDQLTNHEPLGAHERADVLGINAEQPWSSASLAAVWRAVSGVTT